MNMIIFSIRLFVLVLHLNTVIGFVLHQATNPTSTTTSSMIITRTSTMKITSNVNKHSSLITSKSMSTTEVPEMDSTPSITTKAVSKAVGKYGRKVTLRRYLNALVRKNPEVSSILFLL